MKSTLLVGILPTAIAFFSLADAGEPPANKRFFLSEWAGHYLKQSELCTSPADGGNCSEQFDDCLKIEPGRQGNMVELHSTQANQHVCSCSLKMEPVEGTLVHRTQFGNIIIKRDGDSLEISSKGIDSTALGLGICGAHADIDGLKFSLASKSNEDFECRTPN